MRVLVVTHGPEITAGWLEYALEEVGAETDYVDLALGEVVNGRRYDKVIVLGGHMGAYDTAEHQWLVDEKEFLQRTLAEGTPILGVCLGAQLLAEVAGGAAYRSPTVEAGFVTIVSTAVGERDATVAAIDGPVVAWHHDTFDLPPGAELLATTDSYPHAFRVGSALGVQFHPEVTPEMFDEWIATTGTAELEEAGLDPGAFAARLDAERERLRAQAVRFFRTWLEE